MLTATVIGYLGKDAHLQESNGKKVVNFSVAHSEKYKDAKGVATEKTTWVECAYWEREQLAPYLKKGTLVCVQGTPESHAFKNKQGEIASTLKLRVVRVELLTSAPKKDAAPVSTAEPVAAAPEIKYDDLPF